MGTDYFTGKNEIEILNNGQSVVIPKLYLYKDKETPVTVTDLLTLLKNHNIVYGFDEKILQFNLDKSRKMERLLTDVLIASARPAIRKAADELFFLFDYSLQIHDTCNWKIINDYFQNVSLNEYCDFPFPLKLVHKGDKIAKIEKTDDDRDGLDVLGNQRKPLRTSIFEYSAGEGVFYDIPTKTFSAGATGYLLVYDNRLSIKSPFYLNDNKMKLFFLNVPRVNNDKPKQIEIKEFFEKNKMVHEFLDYTAFDKIGNDHLLIAVGKEAGDGQDAEIELFFERENLIGSTDEKGKIDFKEKNVFVTVHENQLLATKKLPLRGNPGIDIMGNQISPRHPRDIILKNGSGTREEKDEMTKKIYSSMEGIVEYKNDTISVFSQINIRGDINLKTGNVRSKSNIDISGNVLAGFEVISEKNITIKGTVEDNCIISAKGDIIIEGGIVGEKTQITCEGSLFAKFIEGGIIKVGKMLNVRRFIKGAKVESLDNIIVFGHGINLNERGAIVDCEIKFRNHMIAPVIGTDAALPTNIYFAYDQGLETKISHLEETCGKLLETINQIKEQFEEKLKIDITSENVHVAMKDFSRIIKDEIIEAIKEINQIKKKFQMMDKMLHQNKEVKDELLKSSCIEISKKIFPPMILHCNSLQKTIDKMEAPSKYYYDSDLKSIERSRFTGVEL